ncbi:Protein of unknown function (DUF3435) domain containing protein [Elaphomyces granulatus]
MGQLSQQELTADELLLARAEANGYQRGAHREADEVCGRDKHVSKTKKNQDATLRRYILWRLGAMRKEYAQKGLSPPDEETARCQYLGRNVTAPDLATVKDFIRFYIATSKPQLDKVEKRPTADSINIAAEWFFAGFTRVTGTDTDNEERSEVYNWVRQTLTREGIVVNKHRPKHNFTDRDLSRVLLTLWTRDDLIFIPERYRVQTTFIIHVYCWTGARIGAFFTDGLRYKDVTLVLQRASGRSWRLIYRVDQRWVKNNRDPENIALFSFGAAAKDHGRLFYNDAGFLLAMAIADDALFGYESLEDVRAQEIPSGKDELILRFKDSALERPILRRCTKTGGVTSDPMPKSSFTAILKSTLTNAGYLYGPSIHAIRRQLGKEVDKRYTAVQRSQHLTQADERVFGQSYVANCSSVDGQAAFRNEESDHRHIEYFQSMEKFHEEGLPTKLPSHLADDIYHDSQLRELENEMQTLAQTGVGGKSRSRPKQRYANRLKKLKNQALRQYQEQWVRERRDWNILTRGKEAAQDKSKTDFVQSICLLIPERGRLAQKMVADHALEPSEMWQALQDLYTLCVQDFTVLYLPKSRPVDGACPVKCCQLRMDSLPKQQRNQHIQNCVRWEMAHCLGRLQSDIHYCYHCFDWVIGEEWEPHCQEHLAALTSKQCGTVTYCHTLVRPGYCPLCSGEPGLLASQQLKPWSRDHKLWGHIDNEHLADRRWPLVCRLCDVPLKDAAALQCHFADEHGLSRTRPVKPAIPSTLDSQDEEMQLDKEVPGAGPSRKRKSSSDTKALEWMPPQSFSWPSPEQFLPTYPPRKKRCSSTVAPSLLSNIDPDKLYPTSPLDLTQSDSSIFSQFIRSPSPEAMATTLTGGQVHQPVVDIDNIVSPASFSENGENTSLLQHDSKQNCPLDVSMQTRPKLWIRLRIEPPKPKIRLRVSAPVKKTKGTRRQRSQKKTGTSI